MFVTIICLLLLIICLFTFVRGLISIKKQKATEESIPDGKEKLIVIILGIVAVILLVLQIAVCLMYSFNKSGNLSYIKGATAFYDSGAFVGNDGLMILWGMISKVFGIHPMILIFSVLPVIMIPFYYLVYYLLLHKLTNGSVRNSITGIVVLMLLNIWGYQSDILIPATMLMSYATMICFFVHAFLPIVLYEVLIARENVMKSRVDIGVTNGISNQESSITCEDIDDEDYQEEWDMKKHKIINARNLAIALGVLALALVAFVFVLNNKINTLHAATANLQRDLSERARIYEFVSDAGKVEGYLIKGSNGEVTMIGGGNVENAEKLNDFLSEYGTNITNWYLYEADEENMGAYAKCTLEKGISVENVYILNRTQIEGLN